MDFEVYCDENHPELFCSSKPSVNYLMIGSLWLPAELRTEMKEKIWQLRTKHSKWGEIKWRKVSTSALPFYIDLVDLFLSQASALRFRCIAVDHRQFDKQWHAGDEELGFYKFYYQVLHHWILDYNRYQIFCDTKTNRDLDRLSNLKKSLSQSNLSAEIQAIQALPSNQVVLIQLSDLLLGAASARLNKTLVPDSAKSKLVQHLENRLGREIAPTERSEQKFNVFKINLQGGW